MSKKYTVGISDGMAWNAGGQTTITAASIDEAHNKANDWADEGDYPCVAPVTITIVMRDDHEEVARWQHQVPDTACSGADE